MQLLLLSSNVVAQNTDKVKCYVFLEKNLRFILPNAFEPDKTNIILIGEDDWVKESSIQTSDNIYRNTVYLMAQIGSTSKPEKLQDALKKTESFATKNPNFFWAQYVYAMNLFKLKESKFQEQWTKILNSKPDDPYGNLLLALYTDDIEKRKGFYLRSILLDPGYSDAHYEYGVFLEQKLNDPNKAAAMYQKAIDINQHADAYNNLGYIYLSHQQMDKALETYTKAVKVHPSNAKLHANKGVTEFYLNDYESAKKTLAKAIELDQDYGFAHFMCGMVYLQTDDKQKGCTELMKAHELGYQQAEQYFQQYCK
jgi:tetratricopeptide (TPR) repeat protein